MTLAPASVLGMSCTKVLTIPFSSFVRDSVAWTSTLMWLGSKSSCFKATASPQRNPVTNIKEIHWDQISGFSLQ